MKQERSHPETLGIKQAVEVPEKSPAPRNRSADLTEDSGQTAECGVSASRHRYLDTKTKMAHPPFHPSLDQSGVAIRTPTICADPHLASVEATIYAE